jgi:hypothetical protein
MYDFACLIFLVLFSARCLLRLYACFQSVRSSMLDFLAFFIFSGLVGMSSDVVYCLLSEI